MSLTAVGWLIVAQSGTRSFMEDEGTVSAGVVTHHLLGRVSVRSTWVQRVPVTGRAYTAVQVR